MFSNATYTTAGLLLDHTGVNQTLSHLTEPSTLFAPTNAAFEAYNNASNITAAEGNSSPLLLAGAQLLVVPGQYYSVSPTSENKQSLLITIHRVLACQCKGQAKFSHKSVWIYIV